MNWLRVGNTEALVRNARHNARFSAVRVPIIFVVSIFLWELSAPAVAIGWLLAMLAVERLASHARDRLINGASRYAAMHLLTLAMMSALWVVFGFVLWLTDTELGRIAATIGLLTAALYGSLGGAARLSRGVDPVCAAIERTLGAGCVALVDSLAGIASWC